MSETIGVYNWEAIKTDADGIGAMIMMKNVVVLKEVLEAALVVTKEEVVVLGEIPEVVAVIMMAILTIA